jgi:hypothetical protein
MASTELATIARSDFTFHFDDNLDGKDERTSNYLVMFDKLPDSPSWGESRRMGDTSHEKGLHTAGELGSAFDPDIIGPMQKPLIGDWNADGKDEVGVVLPEIRWKKTTSQSYKKVDYLCFYLGGGRFVYYKTTPNVSAYPISGNWN